MIEQYVMGLQEVDETQVAVVGGKGAHLGELMRVDGIRVPPGFCVTTAAFRRVMGDAPAIGDIRRIVEDTLIPGDVAAAISDALARCDEQTAYAVRSSAT